MEVRIFTRCIKTEKTRNFNFELNNDVSSIWGLKKALEPKISVAACDQKVYYRKRQLDNEIALSSLYVQEGDCFAVEFVAHCNIEALTVVLRRMREFLKTVIEMNAGLETLSVTTENMEKLNRCCKDIYEAFEMCSADLFLPWKNPSSIANRHFFTQEEGLVMLSSVYTFTSKRFKVAQLQDREEVVMSLNGNQNLLEYGCLITLWNYSETKEDRRMVLKEIGLDMFMKSLVKQPHNGDEYLEVSQINEAAVGCLAQYVEMPNIQLVVADSLEAVKKLVLLSSHSTTIYGNEVAANALFCCSNHHKAALQLVKNKIHISVIEKMQPILFMTEENKDLDLCNDLSIPAKYFFCLFLANIQTLPKEVLGDEEKCNIDAILERFLALHTPSEIGNFEAVHSYVWISMVPFVQIALSAIGPQTMESTETVHNNKYFVLKNISLEICSCSLNHSKEWHSQYSFSSATKLGLFSLCHLTKSKENQELFQKEQIVDYLVCLCWFAKLCGGNFYVPELTGFGLLDPPSLKSISKAYLAKCYGHKLTCEL